MAVMCQYRQASPSPSVTTLLPSPSFLKRFWNDCTQQANPSPALSPFCTLTRYQQAAPGGGAGGGGGRSVPGALMFLQVYLRISQ